MAVGENLIYVDYVRDCDIRSILEIELASFADPWCKDRLYREWRPKCRICLTAQGKKTAYGYVIYELRRTSVRILRMAVAPHRRRQGAGAAMISQLIREKFEDPRFTRVVVSVSESDLVSQLFFRAAGFSGAVDPKSPCKYRFVYRRIVA